MWDGFDITIGELQINVTDSNNIMVMSSCWFHTWTFDQNLKK
jgi:hypothetical protein